MAGDVACNQCPENDLCEIFSSGWSQGSKRTQRDTNTADGSETAYNVCGY